MHQTFDVVNFFVHLRLKFSLFLAPIYLYGIIIANGDIFSWKFLLEFINLHIFLNGGVYALNSYYDRNERGPIGGLENPPMIRGDSLFYFAWFWKLIGLYFSIQYSLSSTFIVSYILCVFMSVLYSHPMIRFKSRPFASLSIAVFLQGFLVYYLGTILNPTNQISFIKFWLGALVIIFLVLGTYPLTQIYQIDQDQRQGDRTFAVVFGAKRTFQFASICLFVSGTLNSLLIGYYYHWWEGVLIVIGSFLFQIDLRKWQTKFFQQTVIENFRTLHHLFSIQTIFPFVFCLAHLLHIL